MTTRRAIWLVAVRVALGALGGLLMAGIVLLVQAATLVLSRCEFDYRMWVGVVGLACR